MEVKTINTISGEIYQLEVNPKTYRKVGEWLKTSKVVDSKYYSLDSFVMEDHENPDVFVLQFEHNNGYVEEDYYCSEEEELNTGDFVMVYKGQVYTVSPSYLDKFVSQCENGTLVEMFIDGEVVEDDDDNF